MKALTWHGANDVRVESVPDPEILAPTDAIIEITASAICGSDLHIYHGLIPMMQKGDILGHEFAGRVIEVGSHVKRVKKGDRVVIPFTISCGSCFFCTQGLYSLCSESNLKGANQIPLMGYQTAGLFGYSHMYGGFAGGQAEYARVPFIDTGAVILPDGISEEHALFLSDIFPTGYMAAKNCDIKPGQTIAIWGCGPVGQFAIRSAFLLGAQTVIAIDDDPVRLTLAESAGAIPLNFSKEDIYEKTKLLSSGRGPDACIDAVGMEAHGHGAEGVIDNVLQAVKLETDKPLALREIFKCCRNGGNVSIPGVYIGMVQNFPFGVAFGKGLNFKMGQTHVQKYTEHLLDLIVQNKIDPRFLISHRINMDEIPEAYKMFSKHQHGCTKVVIHPQASARPLAS
jgi:threonine dehydrogenase-like Zn-dependent dehydrogenase